MTMRPLEEAHNPDLRGSLQAMQRAALRARQIAAQTGTEIVVSRNGVIEYLSPRFEVGEYAAQEPLANYEGKP
jgi:hypothetical protein